MLTENQSDQLEDLYLEMYDRLMSYARIAEESEALAEEAVQETFRLACQEAGKICGSPNPQGWLVLTLRNVIRNAKRSRATASRIVETYLVSQAKEMAFTEDRIHLNILYEDMADMEEFKLLSEMAIEGRTHLEMAAKRNISIDSCKKRVQRAKAKLKKKLNPDVTK